MTTTPGERSCAWLERNFEWRRRRIAEKVDRIVLEGVSCAAEQTFWCGMHALGLPAVPRRNDDSAGGVVKPWSTISHSHDSNSADYISLAAADL